MKTKTINSMTSMISTLVRPILFVAVLALSTAVARADLIVVDAQTTDVTCAGFAVVWKTADSAAPQIGVAVTPHIAVYSDAAGTHDITAELEVTALPLFGGAPETVDEYSRKEGMHALRDTAKTLGLMKMAVHGCRPSTTYYFRISSENGMGGMAQWPEAGLASVTTTEENAFVVDSRQVLVTLTDDPGTLAPEGWLVTASSAETLYPVSSYVGDGAGSNQAVLNLSNLFDGDEDNWTSAEFQVITLEVRPPGSDPFQRGLAFFFTDAFVVSQVHKININVDQEGDETPPGVHATPPGGIYPSAQSVVLGTDEPAYLFYTTDGQVPTVASPVYMDPIQIDADTTVTFMAVDMAGNQSAVCTEIYTIVDNQMPYMPSSPNPADGATGVSVDRSLSWQGGDPDPGDVVTYDTYLGTTEAGMTKICEGLSVTSCQPSVPPGFDTKYYWQVVAKDDKGGETSGAVWQFTTFTRNGDEDGDGLINEDEITRTTDPFNRDTDGDGYEDGDEVAWGSDPKDESSIPNIQCEGDFDGDGDVDGADLAVFGIAFDADSSDADYNSAADFDENGNVGISDLETFVKDFGRTNCPMVFLPADLDRDGDTDEEDLALFIATLGLCQNDPAFNGAADYDKDGCVTNADYVIWYGYYQEPGPCGSGDIDQDGDVDVDDATAFVQAVGRCLGDTGFLPQADCDGDGCITNADYAAWYSSFHP